MLTASKNILQEEWVQRWLDKLTPKQQALVIEVLKDTNKFRKPTPAAMQEADAIVTYSNQNAATEDSTTYSSSTKVNLPTQISSS